MAASQSGLRSNRLTGFLLGLPLTRPLVTGRIGSFYAVVGVAIGTTDTPIAHELGRQPSGYIVFQSSHGSGVVYNGTNNGSDWSPSSIVLAASVAGTYTILVG